MQFPKKYFVLILLICTCIGLIIFLSHGTSNTNSKQIITLSDPDKTTHNITLTSNGFKPETLVIRQGEKVIFTTDRNIPFWPASSFHPTHKTYPEFDSKERVIPPKNWSFTFTKPGSWSYHDHIAEGYTGMVHVLEQGHENKVLIYDSRQNCSILAGNERTECWDTQLKDVVARKGVDAGFEYLLQIYNAESEVSITCHQWVHMLGEAGYNVFKEGDSLELRPETAWCSYGYFHGFMNAMIADTGSLERVVDFCKMAVAQLQDDLPIIESNCLHGIGHVGVDLFFEDPIYWGDFQKTADAGFNLCNELFRENKYLNECYGGVIHGLRFSMRNNQNGMDYKNHLEQKDLYFYCRTQKAEYQLACYSDFASMFYEVFDGDIAAAISYIVENITDSKILQKTIRVVSTAWIEHELTSDNYEDHVAACRLLSPSLFSTCMHGIAVGFMHHGEPKKMQEKAFAFCKSDYLSVSESSLCITQVSELLETDFKLQ